MQDVLNQSEEQVHQLKIGKGKLAQEADTALAAKQSNKAHERLKEIFQGHAKTFSTRVKELVHQELQSNLGLNLHPDLV